MKVTMLTVGVVLAVLSAGLLGVVMLNIASLEPYVGSGGVVAAGLGLVAAAVMIGIGLGRWEHPKPVPTASQRRHEGLQG